MKRHNPSIERTSSKRLRPFESAAHVKRKTSAMRTFSFTQGASTDAFSRVVPSSGWRFLCGFTLVVLVLSLCACQQSRELTPGQIWGYDNRTGEGASTIQILHIERGTPLGDVYFVSVRALDVKRVGRKIRTTEVWPLVFTHEALTRSLRSYQWSEKVNRSHLKQLDLWLRDARDGRAAERTFTVPIKDALDQIESDRPEGEKRRFAEV